MNKNKWGVLYIVATPIGNLQDMSFRAVEVLKSVALIAAEDTRHSAQLLQHFGIQVPTISLHDHNERERSGKLLERLQQGDSIALISDAGTPLISDPGFHLVQDVRNAGGLVVPIPGSCALIAALSASGLATDRFQFEGFLSTKSGERKARLEKIRDSSATIIFYEAPHRIYDFLEELKTIFGENRQAVIARELTKKFETIQGGSLGELIEWMQKDKNQQRGEFVVLVAGAKEEDGLQKYSAEKVLSILLKEDLPVKKAAEIAAKITGERKNDLYQMALQLKNK